MQVICEMKKSSVLIISFLVLAVVIAGIGTYISGTVRTLQALQRKEDKYAGEVVKIKVQ